MPIRRLPAALLALVVLPAAAESPAPTVLSSAGALFGVRENVQHVDISPDGTRIVYLTPGRGRVTHAMVAELGTDNAATVAIETGGNPDRLGWCNFVTNQRLICRVVGEVSTAGLLVPYSRLLAVDIDGKNIAMLGQQGSAHDSRMRQFDGEILDWLPDDEGAVLMSRDYIPEVGKLNTRMVRTSDGLGVDRIDVSTLRASRVEKPHKLADFYMSDGRGSVRIKGYQPERGGSGQLGSRVEYQYRLQDSREWLPFSSSEGPNAMIPIAIDAAANCAYVQKRLDGRIALYRVTLDSSLKTELVHKNDRVDIDGVVRIGRGAAVIGVTFAEEKRSVIYFDPTYSRLARALGGAIPDLPLIGFVGSSADNSKLLIHAGSDSDPGRYYVFDTATKNLQEILLERPSLEGTALANVTPITYPAADGTLIPGYLTLPPGTAEGKGLPAVVLPHGGPSARDEWGFDWLAQFLAHRGYAVLQPNFRGSAGFGDAWMQDNGFKSWQTSIGDVTAAARWLVGQGIADPARMGIVGWSYGGYAALQAGVVEPELFKALVAIAPVTDLELLKTQAKRYTHALLVADEIGSGPHIKAGSPLQNVQSITSPVLMFHGDMDLNVGVAHSRKMYDKLRAAGKRSDVVIYEGLEHSLRDSNARAQMLDMIDAFLATNLGSAAAD